MRDVDRADVAMADRERRARHRRGDSERAARPPNECRLPRSELARDGDDVADREALGEGGRYPLGLARRGAGELDVHVRTGRAGLTRGRARARQSRARSTPVGSSTACSSNAGNPREVLLEHLQHRGRVERGCRVVERVEEHRARAERHFLLVPVHLRDPSRLAREELRREVPERRDDLRLDQLDLPEEVRLAGRRSPPEVDPDFPEVGTSIRSPRRRLRESARFRRGACRAASPPARRTGRPAGPRGSPAPRRRTSGRRPGSRSRTRPACGLARARNGCSSRSPRRTLEVRRRARRRPSGGQSTASPGCNG